MNNNNQNKDYTLYKDVKISNKNYYINPYNFISLEDKPQREKASKRRGNLNGYIKCSLTTKTPVMIPDTQNVVVNNNHNIYQFFNYQEKRNGYTVPVIPGSEIRGMLRSDYETFTNSCMSTLSEDISFISRTNNRNGKNPGILVKNKDGKWTLYKAKRYALHTSRGEEGKNSQKNGEIVYAVDKDNKITIDKKVYKTVYKTGDMIDFNYKEIEGTKKLKNGKVIKFKANYALKIIGKTKPDEKNNSSSVLSGILFIGETGGNKKQNSIHDSIFVKSNQIENIEDLDDEVKKLQAIYDVYNDKGINQKIRGNNKTWYAGYDIKNLEELPVWYSTPVNGKTYLSLASIGKEAYHKKIQELVGEYKPCIDREKICDACYLFGFVSNDDSDSSKIRISDAVYNLNDNPYDKQITIKELASPHIANAAFYSLFSANTNIDEYPKSFDFNYDNKIYNDPKINKLTSEKIDEGNITIRGRKHYWHYYDQANIISNVKNERNCTITPVKSDTKFEFKIYFNNITQKDLKKLVAVINLKCSSNYSAKLAHKIGKGKPLGLGSCILNVDNIYIRNISLTNNGVKYELKDYNSYYNDSKIDEIYLDNTFNMDTISMKEALRIYDLNYIKDTYFSENSIFYNKVKFQYPIGEKNNQENSMNWFMLNKSTNMRDAYIIAILPKIINGKDDNPKDLLLSKYIK